MTDAKPSHHRRLEQAVREYRDRSATGESLSVDDFVESHPEIANELRNVLSIAAIGDSGVSGEDSTRISPLGEPVGRSATEVEEEKSALPRRFGRYEVVRELGRGAMGAVWLATDTELQRQVALKVPRLDDSADQDVRDRFRREARAAAALRHPNVCPVHDVGEIDGRLFLTMAYVEGRPLSEVVEAEAPLEENRAAEIVAGIARGLQAAHRAGIVHRDLKPANVMLDENGQPVVTDFGLARVESESAVRTKPGAILGTPAYMAPEQVRGERDRIGPASDQFALGVVFYRMLTGRLPFEGPVPSVLARIVTESLPSPREHRPGLDPALEAIVLRMTAHEPGERFPGLDAVIELLDGRSSARERFLSEETRLTTASPPRSKRWFGFRWWVAVAVLPVLLLGTGLAVWQPWTPEDQPAPVVPTADIGVNPDEQEHRQTKDVRPEPRWTLVAGGPVGPVHTVEQAHDGGVYHVTVSANGTRLVTCGADETVRVWDAVTGLVEHELAVHDDVVRKVRVTPDGGRALSASEDKTIALWDLDEGKLLRRFHGHSEGVTGIAFLGGTDRFVSSSFDRSLIVWNAETGARQATLGYGLKAPPVVEKIDDLAKLEGHLAWIRDVAATADGSFAVSAGNEAAVLGWNVSGAEVRTHFIGHRQPVMSVAVSPDGGQVLSAGHDKLAILWDVEGHPIRALRGHAGPVTSAAFAPDGETAVTGGGDNTVRLWRLADGAELHRFEGHSGGVNGVTWLPGHENRLVATAGLDGSLRIWRLPKPDAD